MCDDLEGRSIFHRAQTEPRSRPPFPFIRTRRQRNAGKRKAQVLAKGKTAVIELIVPIARQRNYRRLCFLRIVRQKPRSNVRGSLTKHRIFTVFADLFLWPDAATIVIGASVHLRDSRSVTQNPNCRIRVTKWVGRIPAIATCTCCRRVFRIPLTALQKATEATENLRQQFERHSCKVSGPSPSL